MNYLYSNQIYPAGKYPLFRQETGSTIPTGAYFPIAGLPDIFLEEKQSFEDARRLQSFYPVVAQEIQRHAEEECDKMEYEGSMMFDEYPDRIMVRRMADEIADKVKDFAEEDRIDDSSVLETEEELSMQSAGRRRPPRNDNWLGDLAQVILLDEMHRRRCRHRRCRNRRFW